MRRSRERIGRIIGEIEQNIVWLKHYNNIAAALRVEAVEDSPPNDIGLRNRFAFKLSASEVSSGCNWLLQTTELVFSTAP